MLAYELLPRLIYLTLTGQNDEGELEFWGDNQAWYEVNKMENELVNK